MSVISLAAPGQRPVSVAEVHKPRPPSVAQPRASSPSTAGQEGGMLELGIMPRPPSPPVPPSPSPMPLMATSAFGRVLSTSHDAPFRRDTDLR
jgi:hypothetical protein